jgi:hypothetical protein
VDRAGRKDFREKKKKLRQHRKQYLREEKQSLQRQKLDLRQNNAAMRKRIRRDRFDYLKDRFLSFIRQPIKRGHMKPDEKALRIAIREDMKRERRERVQQFPQMVSASFKNSVNRRRDMAGFFYLYLRDSLSGFNNIKSSRMLQTELLKTLFNSTVLFILAFVIVYFASQLVTIFTARFYDIPAVLYSYRIFWPLYTYSSLYTRQALIFIFAAGPVLSLVMAMLFYRIFIWIRPLCFNFKILVLWILFHSINLFFGAYIAGVITRTGFVYTTEWIFYSQVFGVEEIVFLVVSIIALVISGFFLTRLFFSGTCISDLIESKIRIFYILAQVFLPWFLGMIVLATINYPRNPPELLILYIASVLMIIPVLFSFNTPDNQAIRVGSSTQYSRTGWIYLGLLVLAVAVIRKVIYHGINFY